MQRSKELQKKEKKWGEVALTRSQLALYTLSLASDKEGDQSFNAVPPSVLEDQRPRFTAEISAWSLTSCYPSC
jgi:hypothetical protein